MSKEKGKGEKNKHKIPLLYFLRAFSAFLSNASAQTVLTAACADLVQPFVLTKGGSCKRHHLTYLANCYS